MAETDLQASLEPINTSLAQVGYTTNYLKAGQTYTGRVILQVILKLSKPALEERERERELKDGQRYTGRIKLVEQGKHILGRETFFIRKTH